MGMASKQTAADIERIAADWVVREDRRALTSDEQGELDAWLAGDARRQGAYVRAQAAWTMMDRGRAMAAEAAPARRWPMTTRREMIAAGLVGVAGLGGTAVFLRSGERRYRTARGEVLRVPLGDGSSAAINTASRIAVSMSQDARTVKLAQGEAWFEVARDGARPFVVEARDVRVRTAGGAFSIRHLPGGAEVIVSRGLVECWTTADPRRVLRLPVGAKTLVAQGQGGEVAVLPPATIGRLLAWREGMVGLDGETLAEAAAEFNRYNDRQIVIADPEVGRERLIGFFRANDPEAFVRAASDTLGVEVVIGESELRIGS